MLKISKYAAGGIAACLPVTAALAEWAVNMPVGVTELSRDIHALHMLIFWICVLRGLLIQLIQIILIWIIRVNSAFQTDSHLIFSTFPKKVLDMLRL